MNSEDKSMFFDRCLRAFRVRFQSSFRAFQGSFTKSNMLMVGFYISCRSDKYTIGLSSHKVEAQHDSVICQSDTVASIACAKSCLYACNLIEVDARRLILYSVCFECMFLLCYSQRLT